MSCDTPAMHAQDRLNEAIKEKTQLRDNLKKEMDQQAANMNSNLSNARNLIQSARVHTTKLMVGNLGV